ncbi:SusE domain-containing protein [Sinomicrobium sp. M5D2P17]
MKKYTNFLLLFIFTGLVSCDDKDDPGEMMKPFSITFPKDETSIALDPSSNAVVDFEWNESGVPDHTLVFYEVLFDVEGGDFTSPVYTTVSDEEGIRPFAFIPHKEMNIIASRCGIESLQKGNVSMKVKATNGVLESFSENTLTIALERPAGFAENPDELFLTGTATEAGSNIGQAMPFKKISDGVFELYTSLDEGTLAFVDATSGEYHSFYPEGNIIKSGENGESPATGTKVYRMDLDFNESKISFTEIQAVGLWIAAQNQVTEELSYESGGVWKATDIPIVWADVSWGKDERYKFRVTEIDEEGEVSEYFIGSGNKDNARPDDNTSESYYYLKNTGDTSQWDYTYKFGWESGSNDILVKFQPSGEYTHEIIRN